MDTATNDDNVLLDLLEAKLQILRDRTRGVAQGYLNGFYLWGGGGTSKSHTILRTLKDLRKEFKLTNSRVTAKGLFTLLQEFPESVHIIEDAETMFKDDMAVGVLRSALWGQTGRDGKQERIVTWQTAKKSEEFVFTGGIVIVANCELPNTPQLQALKSRIVSVHYQPTNEEVKAKMRDICRTGYVHDNHSLSPQECLEVVHQIIERSERLRRNLDLRLLFNAFHERLQWQNQASVLHWHDLLESRLQEKAIVVNGGTGIRAARKAQELELLRKIAALPTGERLEIWKNETKKSPAAFYRRLDEVKGENSQSPEVRDEKDWRTEKRF